MKNTEHYVRAAVRSVLECELGDIEIIVVDDDSTDRSREFVTAIKDPRIVVVDGPKRGYSAAWNAALVSASGEIVMECDSDDLFTNDRIPRQLEFLDRNPQFGAVCGGFSTISSAGRHIRDLWDPSGRGEEITTELLSGVTRTSLCTFAIRRHLALELRMREFFESSGDIDLQLRLAEICRVWFEPRGVYHYRLHRSSITHTQATDRREFFEQYARDLRSQRASGRQDDIEIGAPRQPPTNDSKTREKSNQVLRLLLGDAWRLHEHGDKRRALRQGIRALYHAPLEGIAWRSLLSLLLKRSTKTRICDRFE